MGESEQSSKFPNELLTDKSFYTLGGASAGVLLICWMVNYVAVDVSWMNYKFYRLLGIILSEFFAVLILFQNKKRKPIRWLFAFLNGILIFMNASGLNIMTAQSSIFNDQKTTYNFYQNKETELHLAGILPLPRMTAWWPDEKLVEQNQQLVTQNHDLEIVNKKLESDFNQSSSQREQELFHKNDSLNFLISNLNKQLSDKENSINQLAAGAKHDGNALQQKLAEYLTDKNKAYDSIALLVSNINSLRSEIGKLKNSLESLGDKNSLLTSQVESCNVAKGNLEQNITSLENQISELKKQIDALKATTLNEQIKQACERRVVRVLPGHVFTQDELLVQQDFWKSFCQSYNAWTTIIK